MKVSNELIRDEILNIVSSITPFDLTENDHIDFVKNWIASGAEIFRISKPDKPDIHLVSYFMVFDPSANEFLLVDHKKAGLWLPPGGHIEFNEHPKDTVKREIQEELGIEAEFLFEEPLFLTATKTAGDIARHTDVSLWYVVKGDCTKHLDFDDEEFYQVRWFHPNRIPYEQSDPHIKRFIDKMCESL
jgi:8-oxo-dGTP pyrophosphatase MutT (NUDIX family)